MVQYTPLKITGMATGLVQDRQEFILPEDAYPVLQNAYVWRERIRRRQGLRLLGRLRRKLTAQALGNTVAAQLTYPYANIYTTLGITGEANAQIEPGSVVITIAAPDAATFTDNGDGTFTTTGVGDAANSSINYATGAITIAVTASVGGAAITANINYFPMLPVMGLRTREINSINNEVTVAFDTKYAYVFVSPLGWEEFIPGTTWTGSDSQFFWTTNYWVSSTNQKIFWETNFNQSPGDPIRYTDGTAWIDFAPQINAAGDLLNQCLAMVPFRGRMLVFNTWEGASLGASIQYAQRIRWAAIGNPFTTVSAIVTDVNANAWRDDIRGQGGFLDIPTSEDIISVGFVRDNLVVFCERSTWQLRYTGRTIQPFQIEKVNTELGAESTFSAVQFDTSLVGVGDKGIVACDSFKSERIDIKIPDLVFQFNNLESGPERVYGIRDFQQKLAYWSYVDPTADTNVIYPNRRLVYNYENDSWAIFTDSLTCYGTYQSPTSLRWSNATEITWAEANFRWANTPARFPAVIAGNQQGYVFYTSSNLQPQVKNNESLQITAITPNGTTPTVITSPNHNLQTGQVIEISNIPTGNDFDNLNGQSFGVFRVDANNLELWLYNPDDGQFTLPQTDDLIKVYLGGGEIIVRDGFIIQSKKFNFADSGDMIQLGFLDILMNATSEGAINLNVYQNYNNNAPVNQLPQNYDIGYSLTTGVNTPDTFFNITIPTTSTSSDGLDSSKFWQRVYCTARSAFITIEYTLSNAQLVGVEQENDVQIDAQIVWIRKAGRQLASGF